MPTLTVVRTETELSVVVSNEPGQLARLTKSLHEAGVNLSAILCVHDATTARVRFTAGGASEDARRWLERSGYRVSSGRVLVLEDAAGSDLPHRVVSALACAGINILSCVCQEAGGMLRLNVAVDRQEAAEEVLAKTL